MGTGLNWLCEKCGRSYPDTGKTIRCVCASGGSHIDRHQGVLPCIHRGIVVEQRKLGCCGFTKIYECKIGGTCAIKKTTRATERDTEGLVFCDECEFREA